MKKKLLFVTITILLCNCEAIFEENISENTVVLLSPTDTSEVTNKTIHFNWQKMLEAAEYQIQLARPNFDNASQILIDSLTPQTIISINLEVGDYQWRVKALNSNFSTDYSTNSFSIK
jgi:hypothetical protein